MSNRRKNEVSGNKFLFDEVKIYSRTNPELQFKELE